jgi:ribulose-phosphate 3-epimerase
VTRLPLDVHLMITDPEPYLDPFIKAGANHITFHIEANGDPRHLASGLRERGIGAGIALNPETPVERILDLLDLFDMALVMTVRPGFGGQSFLDENLHKVEAIRAREELSGRARPLFVQVDGGIDQRTAAASRAAGADVFVAGNSIFGNRDLGAAVRALREAVERAPSPAGRHGS